MLYSAHETTLLGIFSALGVPLEKSPPYSSYLTLQLFKDGGKYFFTVQLNGEYKKIPQCDSSSKCSISQLDNIIETLDDIRLVSMSKS